MKPPKLFIDRGEFDPTTDERLVGDSLFPPQGRPGSLDGSPRYGPRNGQTDTCCAAAMGLGSRIRYFRGFYDMSLDSLATQLNVSEETVVAWEGGQESPTLLQLYLMCDVFKTTPNGLLLGPYYQQDGPLRGLGPYMETLPDEAQMAILQIARICYRAENKKPPQVI